MLAEIEGVLVYNWKSQLELFDQAGSIQLTFHQILVQPVMSAS